MAHLSGDEAMRRAFHEGPRHSRFHRPPNIQRARRRRSGRKSAPHRQIREFRLALRHVGFRSGAASGDRPRGSQSDDAPPISRAFRACAPTSTASSNSGRQDGYVSTILGRRRYMPALRSSNYMLRSAAEREATNAPLQGSAADLMKLAMVRMDGALAREGLSTRACSCRFTTKSFSKYRARICTAWRPSFARRWRMPFSSACRSWLP